MPAGSTLGRWRLLWCCDRDLWAPPLWLEWILVLLPSSSSSLCLDYSSTSMFSLCSDSSTPQYSRYLVSYSFLIFTSSSFSSSPPISSTSSFLPLISSLPSFSCDSFPFSSISPFSPLGLANSLWTAALQNTHCCCKVKFQGEEFVCFPY